MANKVITQDLSEPLGGATSAVVELHAGSGNLIIDRLAGGEALLASGTLEYVESQDAPSASLTQNEAQAALTVRSAAVGKPWFRFPWQAWNAATEWNIHINPAVSADLAAHSGGGNVKLDLGGMLVTHAAADTGGGNVDVVLPDGAHSLSASARSGAGNVAIEVGAGTRGSNSVNARSGAGNVVIRLPGGLAARIQASSGMGRVVVDPCFDKLDKNTFQSPGYDSAADKVEITANSGAGDVIVSLK